jgi:hypothetical protein
MSPTQKEDAMGKSTFGQHNWKNSRIVLCKELRISRESGNKTAPMQQIYPVSMGSVKSFAHSDIDASYTPTLVLPKRVKIKASLEAAIPPPQ